MTTKIEVKLVSSGYLTRHPCHVCGGCTEKVYFLAEAETANGTFRVCEKCLKAGPDEIDTTLEMRARDLDVLAGMTRAMIGRLVLPSYAEWLAACEARGAEIVAENDAWELENEARRELAGRPELPAELGDEVPF